MRRPSFTAFSGAAFLLGSLLSALVTGLVAGPDVSVTIDGVPLDLAGRQVTVEADGRAIEAARLTIRVERLPAEPIPESISVHGETIPVQGHDGPAVRRGETRVLAGRLESDTLVVAGRLQLDRGAELRVRTLTILPGGTLDQRDGSEICIVDAPFDPADTEQWGNGVLCFGRWIGPGVSRTAFARAGQPPPADWQQGDVLVRPDPRQPIRRQAVKPQWLMQPTTFAFDSPPASGPQLADFERIGNLSRGAVVRSEAGTPGGENGVRGHVLLTGPCEVDLQGIEFRDLGRTTATRPTGPGNHIGRYALHLHHAHAPARIEGCSIVRSKKWAIVIHGSSGNRVWGNTIFDCEGAAIVCEDGTERDNLIAFNFICLSRPGWAPGTGGVSHPDKGLDTGLDGSGVWCRRGGNDVRDNVVANAAGACYTISGYYADEKIAGAACDWRDNEGYASRDGLWLAFHQVLQVDYDRSFFRGFTFTHLSGAGLRSYHDQACTFETWTILGDPVAAAQNSVVPTGPQPQANVTTGFFFGNSPYEAGGHSVVDATISGVSVAYWLPQETPIGGHVRPTTHEPTIIRGGTASAYCCILAEPPSGSGGDATHPVQRTVEVNGVDLRPVNAGRCPGLLDKPLVAWAWDRRGAHWLRPLGPSDVRFDWAGKRWRLWHELGPTPPCSTRINHVQGIVCGS